MKPPLSIDSIGVYGSSNKNQTMSDSDLKSQETSTNSLDNCALTYGKNPGFLKYLFYYITF